MTVWVQGYVIILVERRRDLTNYRVPWEW